MEDAEREQLKRDIVDYFRGCGAGREEMVNACDEIRFLGVVQAKCQDRYDKTEGIETLIVEKFAEQHLESVQQFVDRLAAIELRKIHQANQDKGEFVEREEDSIA